MVSSNTFQIGSFTSNKKKKPRKRPLNKTAAAFVAYLK
jgi:hypothetical protein